MMNEAEILTEPPLEFRYGQKVPDPRDGLALFGPCDADAPSHPGTLAYGVVGRACGIELFSNWSRAMVQPWTDKSIRVGPEGKQQLVINAVPIALDVPKCIDDQIINELNQTDVARNEIVGVAGEDNEKDRPDSDDE